MIHLDEYRLARIILAKPERYSATDVELRALAALVEAYERQADLAPELHNIARHIMRAVADEAL